MRYLSLQLQCKPGWSCTLYGCPLIFCPHSTSLRPSTWLSSPFHHSNIATSTLIILIKHLLSPTYHMDDELIPPLSQPLLRKLSITGFRIECDLDPLDKLLELGLLFDKNDITCHTLENTGPEFTKHITTAFHWGQRGSYLAGKLRVF